MTLADVLSELNVSSRSVGEHEHAREGWVQVDCPICTPGAEHFRLGLTENGRVANCWSCGRLSVAEMLVEASGASYSTVRSLLRQVDSFADVEVVERANQKVVLPKRLGPLLSAHRKYLKDRRFDPDELAEVWGLQGLGIAPRLQWRIFIPIVHRNQTVSWTTRSLLEKGKRYITASVEEEAISHKDLLFGMDYCQHACVVVEGPFDVFRVGPGAVATAGTAFTTAQVAKISKFPVRVVCFDNEPAAQQTADNLCEQLAVLPGATYKFELSSKDPAVATKGELKELRSFLR